jgi:hypothetical protein
VSESSEQRVARLRRALADAKVEALQAELAEAQAGGGTVTPSPGAVPTSNWLPTSYVAGSPSIFDKRSVQDSGPVQPLAPAPRSVPLAFRLIVFPWSWWTAFALFMVATAPIALWIFVPLAGAIVGPLTLVVVIVLRLRREHLQLGLLKWGVPATVTGAEVLGTGTYYSGTTYQNVRMAQAHGWHVTREWYSGPGTRTRINYQVNGTSGQLVMHGLPYDGGVILAHSKHPERALCVSSFAYDLARDPSGNWVGDVAGRVVFGAVAMAVFLLAWTAAMVAIYLPHAT